MIAGFQLFPHLYCSLYSRSRDFAGAMCLDRLNRDAQVSICGCHDFFFLIFLYFILNIITKYLVSVLSSILVFMYLLKLWLYLIENNM